MRLACAVSYDIMSGVYRSLGNEQLTRGGREIVAGL
jgi:hypothetical protein